MTSNLKNTFRYRLDNFILLILSCFLFMLANPNFIITNGIGFLGWIIYVPLLFLIARVQLKKIWIYGLIYGAFSYFLFAYWLISYNPITILIVCISYAIIFAVLFILLKISDFIFKNNGWILQWAIICSYEYLKTLGFVGNSYGVTAYTQWKYVPLIQICDVIGVFGLNALMIGCSVTVYAFIQKKIDKKNIERNLLIGQEYGKVKSHVKFAAQKEKILKSISVKNPLIGFSIIFLLTIVSLFYGIRKETKKDYLNFDKITIAAIQNNDNSGEISPEKYGIQAQKLISLTEEARSLNPEIKIVVWPETAVVPAIVYNYNSANDLMRYAVVKSVLEYINLSDVTFVIGNGHYGDVKGKYHQRFNSALVFEGKKNVIPPDPEIYSKQHLVPFSEYFPLEDKFPSIARIFLNGEQTFWTPGTECRVFNSKGLNFSTPICFEDTFTTITRKMYNNGSRCFINLSNDSWSRSKACQNQHLAMAVFRSVENKVPSVRSTSSGETCVIYPDGQIVCHVPSFCESYAIAQIPVIPENAEATTYSKYGDVCGYGMLFIDLLLVLIKIFTVIINAVKLRIKYH